LGEASASASADFSAPTLNAKECKLEIKLPSFSFGFVLPKIPFPPILPFPKFGFALSCKLPIPLDVSAGLAFGGGKVACFDVDQFDLNT
jgi:hypothetical protein